MSAILQIGPHKVQHGDIQHGIDNLMGSDRAHIMYCDPPWGSGTIKYWANLNKKMTGADHVPLSLNDFLSAMFGIAAKYVQAYLLVEYGPKWMSLINQKGVAAGFKDHGIVKTQYRSGSGYLPCDVHLFSKPGFEYPDMSAAVGQHGYAVLKALVPPIASKGAILLDPSCGMGYSAQAALDNGMIFRGNEFNRARLQKTIDRLERSQK